MANATTKPQQIVYSKFLNACRAYFQLNGITANDNVSAIKLNIDGETTNINANVNPNANSGWYTLDGCRLNGKPTTSGVYVNNGRKVVIK